MINNIVEKALNAQLNAEFYSSYLYLSMAAYCESIDLPGAAKWMRIQSEEEQLHSFKFYDYIVERGGRVILSAIDAPPTNWESILDIFQDTLLHEQKVTSLINDLVYLAREQRDNATEVFMQWFVSEQVEEEDNVGKILAQIKMTKGSPQVLYLIDKELSQRVLTPPTE